MLEPYYFYCTVKNTRKSEADSDIGKKSTFVAYLQSILNDTSALELHISFLESAVADADKTFYNDYKSLLKVLRDNFNFTQRLEKKIPDNLNGQTTEDYAKLLISVYNERINELQSRKNSGFWGTVVGQPETKVASLQPSESNSPDTSNQRISETSLKMSGTHDVSLAGIKFIEPRDDWSFKLFNEKFICLLKINKIKLQDEITDGKKEDPCIIEAYKFSVMSNAEWSSAVKQALASDAGKAAHLKKLMETAEMILEPTHQSLLHLINALNELRDKFCNKADAESTRQLYRAVQEMSEMPCLAEFSSKTFLNFILLNSSFYKTNVANMVDIKSNSLEEIQEKIDKVCALQPKCSDSEVNAIRFKNESQQNRRKNFEWGNKKAVKFCHIHGENQTHSSKECRIIQEHKLKRQETRKSVKNVQAAKEEAENSALDLDSDSDSSEYGQFLGIKAIQNSRSSRIPGPRVYTTLACENADGFFNEYPGQIDTAADVSICPYTMVDKLGIKDLQPLDSSIYAFDNSDASTRFAGKQKITVNIATKKYDVEMLFLKPAVPCKRMLIGLDVLSLHPFKVSMNQDKTWTFRWRNDPKSKGKKSPIHQHEPNTSNISKNKIFIKQNNFSNKNVGIKDGSVIQNRSENKKNQKGSYEKQSAADAENAENTNSVQTRNKNDGEKIGLDIAEIFTEDESFCYAEALCDIAGVDPEKASQLMDVEEKVSLTMSLHHALNHMSADNLKNRYTDVLPGTRTIERILYHCHCCTDEKKRYLIPNSRGEKDLKPPKNRTPPEGVYERANRAVEKMTQNQLISRVPVPVAKLDVVHLSFMYPMIQNETATVLVVSDGATNKAFFIRVDSKNDLRLAQNLQTLFSNIGAPKRILCNEELATPKLIDFVTNYGSKITIIAKTTRYQNSSLPESHHQNLKKCLAKNPNYSLARAQAVVNSQPFSDIHSATVIFTPSMLFDEFDENQLRFFLKNKRHISTLDKKSKDNRSKTESTNGIYTIGAVVKWPTSNNSNLYLFGVVIAIDRRSPPDIAKIETISKRSVFVSVNMLQKVETNISTLKNLLLLGNRRESKSGILQKAMNNKPSSELNHLTKNMKIPSGNRTQCRHHADTVEKITIDSKPLRTVLECRFKKSLGF